MGKQIGTGGFPAIGPETPSMEEQFGEIDMSANEFKPCPYERGTCDPECIQIVVQPDNKNRPDVRRGYVECCDCGSRGPSVWASPDEIRGLATFAWNDRKSES